MSLGTLRAAPRRPSRISPHNLPSELQTVTVRRPRAPGSRHSGRTSQPGAPERWLTRPAAPAPATALPPRCFFTFFLFRFFQNMSPTGSPTVVLFLFLEHGSVQCLPISWSLEMIKSKQKAYFLCTYLYFFRSFYFHCKSDGSLLAPSEMSRDTMSG